MADSDALAILRPSNPDWKDYYELTKPRVVMLMMITSVVGMHLATPGIVPWQVLLFGNLGIALCAAAAAVVNHTVDRHIDIIMARTAGRPVAAGRVTPKAALTFAAGLGIVGFVTLLISTNLLTAVLTIVTLVGYAGVYTLYLKRATPQNIVIGGAAGAAPPLLGWIAVTGSLDPGAWLLMLIIFVWTPPHFWALAIHREKEYSQAEVPMLPVTHGIPFTKVCILLYTILLSVVSCLPYVINMSSGWYALAASGLNIIFLYYAVALFVSHKQSIAMKMFRYSIFYLFLLFLVLLIDHYMRFSSVI